jgi:hypothetical protein
MSQVFNVNPTSMHLIYLRLFVSTGAGLEAVLFPSR